MMNVYNYYAIIARTTIVEGKVTYTDKRSGSIGGLALDSQLVSGQVLGGSSEMAKQAAIAEVKQKYPPEQGYKNHDNVQVWIG